MFTICFDTICQGFQPVMEDAGIDNPEGTPVTYETEVLAQEEIDSDPEFYKDCFTCPLVDIGHKTIY